MKPNSDNAREGLSLRNYETPALALLPVSHGLGKQTKKALYLMPYALKQQKRTDLSRQDSNNNWSWLEINWLALSIHGSINGSFKAYLSY